MIVACELEFGAAMSGSSALADRVHGLLSQPQILCFDATAAATCGRPRRDLEASGPPTGALDRLIASHCIRVGYTLVTNHLR